ncbi:hypothetical protein FA95DRAFT_1684629 [Auriscalpium vulgare]|uniref:Uncharacterized protein n=1 Tax=Auriscalpium vulgare TaxID=40419 RepID=A0ACB8R397_9AGAM|nr:hypothetical protein FA95DRAFT_1684629 [Auriscalpium vulgare]
MKTSTVLRLPSSPDSPPDRPSTPIPASKRRRTTVTEVIDIDTESPSPCPASKRATEVIDLDTESPSPAPASKRATEVIDVDAESPPRAKRSAGKKPHLRLPLSPVPLNTASPPRRLFRRSSPPPLASSSRTPAPSSPRRRLFTRPSPPPLASSSTAAPQVPRKQLFRGHASAPTARKKATRARGRDVDHELDVAYSTPEAMKDATKSFDKIHLRPLCRGTLRYLGYARKLWIRWFARALGSLEKAEATLEPDAPLPSLDLVKHFFHFVATKGRSGLNMAGKTGWTNRTLHNFITSTWSMRKRAGTQDATPKQREQVQNAFAEWVKVDKAIVTDRLPKRSIRETDFTELMATLLSPAINYTNLTRVQVIAFCALLYQQGSRPGCISGRAGDYPSDQFLKWGHLHFVIAGWQKGLGLAIQAFITFHYMKNMRHDAGNFVQTSMRTLERDRIHLDGLLPLLALAVADDIFEDDVIELMKDRSKLPADIPYLLKIKESALDKPVFKSTQLGAKNGQPWSYNGIQFALKKVTDYMGWEHCTLRSFRYAFAGRMLGVIPDDHLKYLMGHKIGTQLAKDRYQVPDRPIDVSAACFGEEQSLDVSDWHSSVAFGRTKPANAAAFTIDELKEDAAITRLLAGANAAEVHVLEKFGKKTVEMTDADDEMDADPLVTAAKDAWAALIERYTELATSVTCSVLPEKIASAILPASAPKRAPRKTFFHTVADRAAAPSVDAAPPSVPPPPPPPPKSSSSIHTPATTFDAVLDGDFVQVVMESFVQGAHPLLPLIDTSLDNPRLAVFLRFCALLRADRQLTAGQCPLCLGNELLSSKIRDKRHNNLGEHVWGCEERNNPFCWQCSVCATLVPSVYNFSREALDALDPDEKAELEDALETHQSRCYRDLLAMTGISEHDASARSQCILDDDDHGNVVEVPRARKKSYYTPKIVKNVQANFDYGDAHSLSVQSRIANKAFRRLYCPVCLFDETKWWSTRLKCYMNASYLYHHIRTHWCLGTKWGLKWKVGHDFKCGRPGCAQRDDMLELWEMISHLHIAHGYNLVECNRTHEHLDDCAEGCNNAHHEDGCFILREEDLHYLLDVAAETDSPPPGAYVLDFRKTVSKPKQTKAGLPSIPEEGEEENPPAPESAPADPAADPDEARLSLCVDAFLAKHPKFKKCGDITQTLLDADIDCAMILEYDADRLRGVVPTFTVGAADKFKKFSVQWLQEHPE